MATPDSIGTSDCQNCGREVFVRKNRGGFAYYRCEACGCAVQHHIHRGSESFIKNRVRLENLPVAVAPGKEISPENKKEISPEKSKPARGSLAELMGVGA